MDPDELIGSIYLFVRVPVHVSAFMRMWVNDIDWYYTLPSE